LLKENFILVENHLEEVINPQSGIRGEFCSGSSSALAKAPDVVENVRLVGKVSPVKKLLVEIEGGVQVLHRTRTRQR